MKKYLIQISGLGNLEFTLPVLTGRKSEILSKILFSLGIVSFFLLIAVLPYSNLFSGKSFEQSSFETLILFMCTTLAFLGSFLLLQGKKVLVDPKYFLSVLLFALLTTAASVLKSPAHISNTFGIELVRSLSGVTIMSIVGFYFFFNLVAKDFKTLNKLVNTFKFSLVVLIIILMFHTNVTDVNFVNNNLAIVLFAYFFLTLSLVFTRTKLVLKSILLAVSAIFVFLTPQAIPSSIISTQVITAGAVSLIILGVLYLSLKKQYVRSKLSQLSSVREGFKEKKYSLSEVSYFLLLSVSVIAILVGVLVHFKFNFSFDVLLNPLNSLINDVKATFAGTLNFQALAIGSGSFDTVKRISNLDSFLSSVVNVFVTQGLIGLTAYVFILVTSLMALFKSIKKSLSSRSNRGFVFLMSFTIVFVAIYSFFSYGGELLTILFWFAFATLGVYLNLKSLKDEYMQKDWNVQPIFIKGKLGVYLRILLSVLIILISILAVIAFSKISV
ncbi:MAG: hypothetical protein ACMG57_00600 [Candidatus Dojkabacteria bacterium]